MISLLGIRRTAITDSYSATAAAYDLFAAATRPLQLAALEAWLPLVQPEAGPILDVGAGSGVIATTVLRRVTSARVLALEPSRSMRALLLSRLAIHPEWFDRITVRPEGFFEATLPQQVGGAILLGVLGHFDAGERSAVFAELAARLPDGGAALLDLQAPERPTRVEAHEFTVAQLGDLTYRGIAEAWPVDAETLRWRMTYLSLEGERVLTEDTAEFTYRHPAPEIVAAEARQLGLQPTPLPDGTHWILRRDTRTE